MDAELKAYLDAMRQDLMDHTAQVNKETRHDLMAHTAQLNKETRHDLMAHTNHLIEGLREDTTRRFDAVDQQINETHVLLEDLRHYLQGVAEGVTTVREQLGRTIADHEERLTRLERRVP